MGRRRFTREFKRESVRLFRESGKKLTVVARELGVRPQVLRAWERMVLAEEKTGLTSSEHEELIRLRKENERLRMEREILKKATAFFAKENE